MKTRFHRRGVVVALGSLVVLAGCTSLDAVRVTADTKALPAAGAPYSLPFTQYEITVTRRLTSCTDGLQSLMEVATTAEINAKNLPDPARQYVIDFDSLQGAFKKANLTVDYHPNGGIKSINASAEDRTGAVVASAVKIVGTLATAGVVPSWLKGREEKAACDPEIQKLLTTTIPALEKKVADATTAVSERTAEVDRLVAMATAMGKAWGKTEGREMGKAVSALALARANLGREQKALADGLKRVSHVAKVTWPADGDVRDSTIGTVPALPEAVIAKWGNPENLQQLVDDTQVHLRLQSTNPIADRGRFCSTGCPGDSAAGLKYRMPVPGQLVVFTRPLKDGKAVDDIVASKDGMIPQLGPVFVVPLKSVPFSKKKVVAQFDEGGLPTSLGVESDATAEAAAATLEGVITSAAAVHKSLQGQETEQLKAQTELLKARKELADARKALEPPVTDAGAQALAAFQADTALKQAELANLEATRALAEARQVVQEG